MFSYTCVPIWSFPIDLCIVLYNKVITASVKGHTLFLNGTSHLCIITSCAARQ